MNKKEKYFKVYEKKEDPKVLKRKKIISTFLLVTIIIGTISLIGINFYIVSSISGINITADEFEDHNPNNETIILEGNIEIDNRHWNSIDIRDLEIKLKMYIEDDIKIIDKTIEKKLISSGKITDIELEFEFNINDWDINEFNSINSADEVEIEISLYFEYALYKVYLELSFTTEID